MGRLIMGKDALVPIEQRAVIFYDDELTAVVVDVDGRQVVYVPVRPICDYLGIQWAAQSKRIKRDPVLSQVAVSVSVMDTQGRQRREMTCLPLDFLNGWMFGINASRIRDEQTREHLIRYQMECYRVLADAFLQDTAVGNWTTTSPETRAALEQIRQNALAVARLAEEQLRLGERLDKAAVIVGQHNRRITALEQRLAPNQAITDAQAADVAEKVKALAMFLTAQDNSKNHFQSIYNELYRRFRVTSYKTIRQEQYQAVLDFLDEWAAKLGDTKQLTDK
ncbi:MAG TPA: hypothetical protein ENK32_03890 [Anaerolineae bacterium]|nr:hypothetical protein [Anaerolineae bacterium]